MERYISEFYDAENDYVIASGVLKVSYPYRIFEFFAEKTLEQLKLPKIDGAYKNEFTVSNKKIVCTYESVSGYVPIKNFTGTIVGTNIEFSATQVGEWNYILNFCGHPEEVDNILKKLKISL